MHKIRATERIEYKLYMKGFSCDIIIFIYISKYIFVEKPNEETNYSKLFLFIFEYNNNIYSNTFQNLY